MMASDLDWSDLRYFLALSREGSLSGAARSLGVHASTVSRRLDAMESELGAVLFKRGVQGYVPTEIAAQIVEPGQVVERQMRLIRDLLSGESSKAEGQVRLSVTPDFEQLFLASHLHELRSKHPRITLNVSSEARLVDLISGDADIALRYASPDAPAPVPAQQADSVFARRVGGITSHVYTSQLYLEKSGLTAQSCASEFDFIAPNEARRPGAEWVKENVKEERIVGYSGNFTATIKMLESGLGAAVLPRFVGAAGKDLLALSRPALVSRRATWLLWPRDLRNVARVRAVIDFLLQLHKDHEEIFSDDIAE